MAEFKGKVRKLNSAIARNVGGTKDAWPCTLHWTTEDFLIFASPLAVSCFPFLTKKQCYHICFSFVKVSLILFNLCAVCYVFQHSAKFVSCAFYKIGMSSFMFVYIIIDLHASFKVCTHLTKFAYQ